MHADCVNRLAATGLGKRSYVYLLGVWWTVTLISRNFGMFAMKYVDAASHIGFGMVGYFVGEVDIAIRVMLICDIQLGIATNLSTVHHQGDSGSVRRFLSVPARYLNQQRSGHYLICIQPLSRMNSPFAGVTAV
jgi:hypothetical protein